MLHQHLTVAFRELDHKWGKPVDLDTSEDSLPCLPAVIENPTTTFSSEEYLITLKRIRPTPYSRDHSRKLRTKDSFSNVSVSRFQSTSDLGRSDSSATETECENTCGKLMEEMKTLIEDLKKPLDESLEESSDCSSTVELKKEELERVFGKLKNKAFSYVQQKYTKKVRNERLI